MRVWCRSLAVAAAVLALLPAAAAAQSAGDEQYSDPFGSQQNSSPAPAATPAPAAAAPAQAAATPAPAAPAAGAAATAAPQGRAQAAELPRSGWDAGVPGVAGLVLLATGVALRARVRRDA